MAVRHRRSRGGSAGEPPGIHRRALRRGGGPARDRGRREAGDEERDAEPGPADAARAEDGAGEQQRPGGPGHGHADVAGDKRAAFVALVAGMAVIGAFMYGMVQFTNARFAGHEGGERPAAEASR